MCSERSKALLLLLSLPLARPPPARLTSRLPTTNLVRQLASPPPQCLPKQVSLPTRQSLLHTATQAREPRRRLRSTPSLASDWCVPYLLPHTPHPRLGPHRRRHLEVRIRRARETEHRQVLPQPGEQVRLPPYRCTYSSTTDIEIVTDSALNLTPYLLFLLRLTILDLDGISASRAKAS